MTKCEQYISGYASDKDSFSASELRDSAVEDGITAATVNWTIQKMASDGKLFRTGRGIYTTRGGVLQQFRAEPDESLRKMYSKLSVQYPTERFCLYKGTILSPLLHHLSHNGMTYLEASRDLTEILFHKLKDREYHVYLKPSWEMMQNYVDISGNGIIIKPLISGSPLVLEDGVPTPSLEKILVDTLCDEDFSYLRGGEWQYMIDTALSTFAINASRLLRYAGRRGKGQEFSDILKDRRRFIHPRISGEDYLNQE